MLQFKAPQTGTLVAAPTQKRLPVGFNFFQLQAPPPACRDTRNGKLFRGGSSLPPQAPARRATSTAPPPPAAATSPPLRTTAASGWVRGVSFPPKKFCSYLPLAFTPPCTNPASTFPT